jgi:methyl-accepting chemotaxis protein
MNFFTPFKIQPQSKFVVHLLRGITIITVIAITLLLLSSSIILRIFIGLTGLATIYVFVGYSYKKFFSSISHTITIANQIAEGNLIVKLPDNSQNDYASDLLYALNIMSKQLTLSFKQIRKITQNINDNGISYGEDAQKLAQSATEMAATIEQISSAIQEMASNIHLNRDNAHKTQALAKDALNGVRKGNESTQRVRESMNLIAQKISVVQEIAAQTNILALNAAVEAARAGEAGRGFSVVATEVKKLAEKSRVSSTEIEKLTRKALLISERAGIDLEKLLPQISRTVELVDEIANASSEQQIGADHINTAINQLNQVSQENATSSEMLQNRSGELIERVELLQDIIKDFKVN